MVARYAWGRDYHNLIGKRLDKLRKRLLLHGVRAWGGVDASPIYERGWAWAAGLGFTGKNCLQILPSRGSYFFLAVMFVDAPLEGDGPMADFCGRCTRCLTGCPTGAFLSPRRLDAGRCISYWTIEARELAPPELLPAFGRWIFGCDLCQEVCPHNHRPDPADEDDLLPRNAWLDLDELIATPDDALEAQYTGTPLRRPGARGLKRNALVALGNIGDPGAEHSITLGLNHPDGMVRDAAAWAAARLAGDTLRARR
jgi:epoxyqueuosine reductase